MPWFFTKKTPTDNSFILTGEDYIHIAKSLRMKTNEEITIMSSDNNEYSCIIEDITNNEIKIKILSSETCKQEADVKISLFMALVKGDKFDDIIQKSVELGVYEITPVITERCISRPDKKQLEKKTQRWQKISLSAAMQSRRGIIPKINDAVRLSDIDFSFFDNSIVFYEAGGEPLRQLINDNDNSIAILIGPEGGFDKSEIETLKEKHVNVATLGKRILRAQTAPLAAITTIMYITENLE